MVMENCYRSVKRKENSVGLASCGSKKVAEYHQKMLMLTRMNPLDRTAPGIDHGPKRCVSALVMIVAHSVHVTIGRYDKNGDHQKNKE